MSMHALPIIVYSNVYIVALCMCVDPSNVILFCCAREMNCHCLSREMNCHCLSREMNCHCVSREMNQMCAAVIRQNYIHCLNDKMD